MSQIQDHQKQLDHIKAVLEEIQKDRFAPEEREILDRMINLWQAFEVFGILAGVLRNIFIYVGFFILLWVTPFSEIISMVKKYLGFS